MKRKVSIVICVLLACSMLLSACTSGTPSGTTAGTAPAANPTDASANGGGDATQAGADNTVVLDGVTLSREYAGTTISFVGGGGTTAFGVCTTDYINTFEEATGITVEIETLGDTEISRKLAVDSAAGGDGLDVFMLRPGQETKAFVQNGWVRDISSFMDDEEYDFGDITEESLKVCMVDGKLYSIPVTVEHTMLFYNTELFAQAGLDRAPETLDELLEYCETLKSKLGDGQYAMCLRGQGTAAVIAFAPFLYAFGGEFIDENNKAVFDSDEAIQAFEYYAKLINDYCPEGASAYTTTEAYPMMSLGSCAMYIDYDSHYAFIVSSDTSNITDTCAYATFPTGPAGFTPTGPVAWSIGIAENTQNPEACEMFVKWITSKGFMDKAATYGQLSARVSCTTPEKLLSNFNEQYATVVSQTAPYANPYDRPIIVNGTEARQIVGEVIDYANAGHTGDDLKQFATDACARVQALIDSEG